MKKLFLLGIAFFLISNISTGNGLLAASEKPVVLTYTHFIPSVGLMGDLWKKWAALIEERTGGRVKIKFFWSLSLMQQTEVLQGVSQGIADIGIISGGYFPTQLPKIMILEHAYNASDVWVGARATWRLYQSIPDLQDELAKSNLINIAPYASGVFQLFTKDAWSGSESMRGRTIRTMGGPRATWYTNLGAKPVFMQVNDCYEAIERGVLWGFENTLNLANDLKQYEVVKTLVLVNSGIVGSTTNGMNLKKFKSLPQDIQKIIMDVGTYWGDNILARGIYEREKNIIEEWKKKGITIARPSSQDIAKMKKVARDAAMELAIKQDERYKTAGQTVKILKTFYSEVDKAERELAEKGYPWTR